MNQDILSNNDEDKFLSSLYTFVNDLNTVNNNEYEEEIYQNMVVQQENIETEDIPAEIVEESDAEDMSSEEVIEDLESEDISSEEIIEESETEDLLVEPKIKHDIWKHSTLTIFDKLYSIYENKK